LTARGRDAGFGSFGAVGFSYGGEAPATAAAESGSDISDDSEEESDVEEGDERVAVDAEVCCLDDEASAPRLLC
jgi:hypothetical protein